MVYFNQTIIQPQSIFSTYQAVLLEFIRIKQPVHKPTVTHYGSTKINHMWLLKLIDQNIVLALEIAMRNSGGVEGIDNIPQQTVKSLGILQGMALFF